MKTHILHIVTQSACFSMALVFWEILKVEISAFLFSSGVRLHLYSAQSPSLATFLAVGVYLCQRTLRGVKCSVQSLAVTKVMHFLAGLVAFTMSMITFVCYTLPSFGTRNRYQVQKTRWARDCKVCYSFEMIIKNDGVFRHT